MEGEWMEEWMEEGWMETLLLIVVRNRSFE
jgi:hypothetical protein